MRAGRLRGTSARRRTLLLPALAAVLLAAAPAAGQFVEEIDSDRPEAWAMRWFTGVATPTAFGAPERAEAWKWELSLEGGLVPSLSKEERTVGFYGTKEEDLNRAPVFGRPVVRLTLPADFSMAVGWVPPVDLDGVEANLVSLAVARPFWTGQNVRIGGQLAYLTGDLEGDITCPADEVAAGDDPIGNPFGCDETSNDTLSIDAWSFELALAWALSERFELFASGLVQQLDSDFHVRARYEGFDDRTKLVFDGDSWALTAGFGWKSAGRFRVAGELFWMPLEVVREPLSDRPHRENDDLLNARLLLGWKL